MPQPWGCTGFMTPSGSAKSLTYPEQSIQDAGVLIARTIDRKLPPASGADDKQLPAVSKLPPLVACYLGAKDLHHQVETAVRATYSHAVRANILCGGDSCGRAWIIGPVMAACHGAGGESGIPLSWLARVNEAAGLYGDIERLVLS